MSNEKRPPSVRQATETQSVCLSCPIFHLGVLKWLSYSATGRRMPLTSQALVLIVDDFDDALEIYGDYLTFKGYRVIVARSGAEAIQTAHAQRPSMIFMDLRMPHMTGTEAMWALRADPSFAQVPIVAFTAHAFEDEIATALRDGFDEVIAKPCNPDALIAVVERLSSSPQV